ncbi:MAG: AAA family ATPase, partial [Pseudomonadota bacterium]
MHQTMVNLKDRAFSPDSRKVLDRRWRIGQVAQMVGRSTQAIRDKQSKGIVPRPEGSSAYVYDLEHINLLRDEFGTRPARAPDEEPAVLAFQTFKGGAGKSTLAVHFAQYMALKGYRCALIDCDPQGTASTLFASHPALAVADKLDADDDALDYSLEEYMQEDFSDFSRCIRASYFPGVDIIPAGLSLNNADYYLAANIQNDPALLNRLKEGIQSVWHAYDVIVLDPPPALGLLSLSVMNAANCLAIPVKPTVIDFASTWQFLEMTFDNISVLQRSGIPPFYHFDAFVVNNMSDSKSAHVDITSAMK